jgi:hypothetical protein
MKIVPAGFRQLLQDTAYRTQNGFFFLLSIVVFFVAAFILPPGTLRDAVLQFSVTLAAVALIQTVWDFLGGDPVNRNIRDLQTIMERQITFLADQTAGNIGIERMWPNRQAWKRDTRQGLEFWHESVCRSKKINIVSTTLWTNWLQERDFRARLFESIASGAKVRILLYDPFEEVFKLRPENHPPVAGDYALMHEIGESLKRLVEGLGTSEAAARARFELGLTTQVIHMAQIIWLDDRMLVAHYLTGKGGGASPIMQLQGSSAYYQSYAEQFEILWGLANVLSYSELCNYVQRFPN